MHAAEYTSFRDERGILLFSLFWKEVFVMNEIMEKEIINVENMIYEIDGKEVMLDDDLAKIYQIETKRINEAVKNNPEKFPSRYFFRLSESKYTSIFNSWNRYLGCR